MELSSDRTDHVRTLSSPTCGLAHILARTATEMDPTWDGLAAGSSTSTCPSPSHLHTGVVSMSWERISTRGSFITFADITTITIFCIITSARRFEPVVVLLYFHFLQVSSNIFHFTPIPHQCVYKVGVVHPVMYTSNPLQGFPMQGSVSIKKRGPILTHG